MPAYSPRERRRMDRVLVLIETMDEPYEAALKLPTDTTSGFAPTRRVDEVAPGEFIVRTYDPYDTGVKTTVCPSCNTVNDEQDPLYRDEGKCKFCHARIRRATYTIEEIDFELERLRALERVRAGLEADLVEYEDVFELARRRDSSGSYREVRALLPLAPGLAGEELLAWLSARLDTVRVPHWALLAEQDQLRHEISGMAGDGLPRQEVARLLELDHATVKRLWPRKERKA